MNLDETTDELDARTRMATALQTLGHHLVGHRVEPDLADRVAAIAESLTAEVATRPSRNRTAEIAANPRFATRLSGARPDPIGVDGNPMDLFRASVQTWPEVVECASLTGEMDYLLRVVVADMGHYSRFIMDTLLKHPSVQDCKTSFVLDRVKATTAVPV